MNNRMEPLENRNILRRTSRNLRTFRPFDMIIQSRRIELTQKLQDAVELKIGRVRQYAPEAFRARVYLYRELKRSAAEQFRVSVRYEMPGNDIVAEHYAHEPLTALDFVAKKVERRLRKRKTATLASRFGRRGKPVRIADYCDSDSQ